MQTGRHRERKKKQYNEQYRLLPSDVAITGTRGYKDSQNGIIKINAVEEHNNEHSTSRYKNSNSRFLGSGPMAVDRYRIPIESNLIWRRSSFFFNGLTTYSIVTIHNHASIIQESFKGARNRAPVPIMLLPARLTDWLTGFHSLTHNAKPSGIVATSLPTARRFLIPSIATKANRWREDVHACTYTRMKLFPCENTCRCIGPWCTHAKFSCKMYTYTSTFYFEQTYRMTRCLRKEIVRIDFVKKWCF